MELAVIRALLPAAGIAILLLTRRAVKPPARVWRLALGLGWVAGAVAAGADTVARVLRLWHYAVPGLIAGLPVDLYVSGALVYGSSLLLLYWWLRGRGRRYAMLVPLGMPLYGLARDAALTALTGSALLVWDVPYWWIPDALSWAALGWITVLVFERSLLGPLHDHRNRHSR
jgi:hypothetical protein